MPRKVPDVLCDGAWSSCTIGHVHAERFAILAQDAPDDALRVACDEIEERCPPRSA